MVFCNSDKKTTFAHEYVVTILILIDGFLQYAEILYKESTIQVTILILIDGFLQLEKTKVIVLLCTMSQSLF